MLSRLMCASSGANFALVLSDIAVNGPGHWTDMMIKKGRIWIETCKETKEQK